MRVLLTGATGLVGVHVAARLANASERFRVRALVRSPAKLAAVLAPLGVHAGGVEAVAGDITDTTSVRSAMAGCDAVVHAAGLYSADVTEESLMQSINVEGTRCVLGAAIDAGCDPVVHVSSYLALFPPQGLVQRASDPVTAPRSAYARTKADAERIARECQARGAPVVTLYPGAIHGPEDPTFGASPAYLAEAIRTRRMLVNRGGRGYVDVRDLAELVERCLVSGHGPRRLMCGGRHVADTEVHALLCRLSGQPIRALRIPGALLRGMGRLGDLKRMLTGRAPALTYEAACVITRSVPCDDTDALTLLGRQYLDMGASLRDLLAWMARAGHLQPDEAVGALADTARTQEKH
jgi:nucleoside-diphosphate-sugar epimerase